MDPIKPASPGSTANEIRRRALETEPVADTRPAEEAAVAVRPTGHSGESAFVDPTPVPVALTVPPTIEARSEAVAGVDVARRAYTSARTDVNRLNGHLEQGLRTNVALRDPASAERFRTAFMETHRDTFDREGSTARTLADSIRAAEPLLRGVANPIPTMFDAPATRDRMAVARGLDTLAQSSQFPQAAQLAGQLAAGPNAPLPPEVANGIADRAALTGVREDLARGSSIPDAMTRASTLLGGAGFVSRIPALSSVGNALAVGENAREFMRTGDPARIGAMGFSALGAGGAAWAAAVGGGPITLGVAAVAFTGKVLFEQVANHNDYRRDTDPAIARAFGVDRRDLRGVEREVQDQVIAELRAQSPANADAYRRSGGAWLQVGFDNAPWMQQRSAELMAQRMAAFQPR